MEFQSIITTLQTSPEWKHWHESHTEGFLAYGFVLLDEANKDIWQIGYFFPKTDKMTTFVVNADKVNVSPESEVMKDESGVLPLKLSEVKIDCSTAMQHADQAKNDSFSAEQILKVFFVLQTLNIGTIYNVTFVTKSLRTLNFKISASTGEILKQSSESLIHVDKK